MNQTQYTVFQTIMKSQVGGKPSKQEEADTASMSVPVLSSDMSSIMTVTSLDSLDVLSPRGTPMKNWLNCFYPSATKAFEVEYDTDRMETMVPSTISSLPPVAEVLRHVDTGYLQQVVEDVDCDTNSRASATSDSESSKKGQTYESMVLQGKIEEQEMIVESSFADNITLWQEDGTESDIPMEEMGEPEMISSVDFLFAFVWVVMSLWLLNGYTLSQVDVGYFFSTLIDVHLPASTTVIVPLQEVVADGFIHTTQLLNAVLGESVCSILGSSCIA